MSKLSLLMQYYKSISGYINNAFRVIQDVFSTTPALVGSDWVFPALVGNDVVIKNTQIFKTDGLGVALYHSTKVIGGKPIDYTLYFEHTNLSTAQCYFHCGGDNNTYKGFYHFISNNGYMYVYLSDGIGTQFFNSSMVGTNISTYYISGINKIQLTWNGVIGGTLGVKLNDITVISGIATRQWSGESTFLTRYLASNGSRFFNGTIYRIISNIFNYQFDTYFQDGYGNNVLDNSDFRNDLLVQNVNAYDIWQRKSDIATPKLQIKGGTILQNSFSSNLINKVNNDDINIDEIKGLYVGATEYTVNAEGTGDYQTIRAALRANLGTASARVIINVQAGTYYEQDIIGSNYVWLKGIGEVIIISDGLSTSISSSDYAFPAYINTAYNLIPTANKHAFYLHETMLITGIKSIANDVKYNVHSDLGGEYKYYIADCEFTNNSYNIGIGSFTGQSQNYINIVLKDTNTIPIVNRILFHNTSNNAWGVHSLFQNCTTLNGGLITIDQLLSATSVYDFIELRSCTCESGFGISYGAALSTYPYTINVLLNGCDDLVINQGNRPNYLTYFKTELTSGFFKCTNTIDGLQIAGLETGATFEDINTLSGGNYEVEKTANNITRLKIKA